MGTTAILWSLATIGALAGLFAGLIRLSRMLPVRRPIRILGAIALWFVASTATCWLLFARADAAATLIHGRNAGMPLVYLYFWFLAIIPAPILGGAIASLFRWED
jgi:hypothetical protein